MVFRLLRACQLLIFPNSFGFFLERLGLPADTETLTSFELGFKSTLYDGRMRWSADIYTFGIDDQQLTATGGVGNTNSILNADHTKGAGFETELEVLISDNFRLSGNMSYNDTEIDDPNLLAEQAIYVTSRP